MIKIKNVEETSLYSEIFKYIIVFSLVSYSFSFRHALYLLTSCIRKFSHLFNTHISHKIIVEKKLELTIAIIILHQQSDNELCYSCVEVIIGQIQYKHNMKNERDADEWNTTLLVLS